MSDNSPDNTVETVKDAASDAVDTAKQTAQKAQQKVERSGFNPVQLAHNVGIRSSWAYIGAFASIGLSLASWIASRINPADDKSQSDRWGIFIGHWAPTFFALGLALENRERR